MLNPKLSVLAVSLAKLQGAERASIMRMVLVFLVMSSFSYSVHAENLGQWSNTTSLPNIPISIAVLPNNKVLTWSADDQYTFSGTVGTTPTPTLNTLYAI